MSDFKKRVLVAAKEIGPVIHTLPLSMVEEAMMVEIEPVLHVSKRTSIGVRKADIHAHPGVDVADLLEEIRELWWPLDKSTRGSAVSERHIKNARRYRDAREAAGKPERGLRVDCPHCESTRTFKVGRPLNKEFILRGDCECGEKFELRSTREDEQKPENKSGWSCPRCGCELVDRHSDD